MDMEPEVFKAHRYVQMMVVSVLGVLTDVVTPFNINIALLGNALSLGLVTRIILRAEEPWCYRMP